MMKIIEEGLHTTIQDLGRVNYQSYGFSPGGPMDKTAMRIGNYLVGNEDNEAVLEMCFIGPTIEFTCDSVIAVTGAEMTAFLNGKELQLHRPVPVFKGDNLQCRACKKGIYAYLSVKGGIRVEKRLGSRSMIARYNGDDFLARKIKNNDQLPIQPFAVSKAINWKLNDRIFNYIQKEETVVRFLNGAQFDWFADNGLSDINWKISPKSNRMGYRLIGDRVIETIHDKQLLTEPVQFGAIQIPPDGMPIILMADGQPTGGYPKIGQVIQADLPKLSQLTPAKSVKLERCTMESAIRELKSQENFLSQLKQIMLYRWREIGDGIKL
ncbi:antagonist of KipI [Gracilibacillus ureilyticus]|uniref:Antagonist of KipI n=1 Tax=Gracilibacillus ureilyticus TaxID=531814 RepID=A0A1H9PWC7_9BACI|nr:biotin-dependent carboxyltransferase family protein [Gracilibacillus ureilyticus]SER52079.1 antagonist of KipI [Gracilibacillus ureilyticus]